MANPLTTVKMSELSSEQALAQLESILRLVGRGSNFLPLEAVDPLLLAELREAYFLNNPSSENGQSAPRPQQRVSRRSQPGKTKRQIDNRDVETVEVKSPKIEKILENTSMDLNPESATSLDSLRLRLKDCQRCKLCQGRKTIVYGQGNQNADLLFVGEGPGADEDVSGLAFVGKAGKLLTQIIQSLGISRDSVFICNVVKCRPPGNRNPEPDEVEACRPFLAKQIELIKPKLIVTLGNVPTKALVSNAMGITRMRGKRCSYNGIPLIPTYHPSFLLRKTTALAGVWEDMRLIRQILFQHAASSPSKNHQQVKSVHEER